MHTNSYRGPFCTCMGTCVQVQAIIGILGKTKLNMEVLYSKFVNIQGELGIRACYNPSHFKTKQQYPSQ